MAHSSQLPLHPSTQAFSAAFLTFSILVISSRCISEDACFSNHDLLISSAMVFCVRENRKLARSLSPSCFLASALANSCRTVVMLLATMKSPTSRLLRRRLFWFPLSRLAVASAFLLVDLLFRPASRRATVEALVRGDPTSERSG